MKSLTLGSAVVLTAFIVACGGGKKQQPPTTESGAPAAAPAPESARAPGAMPPESAAKPMPAGSTGAGAAAGMGAATDTSADPGSCPPISQALISQGRGIFTGMGNCHSCHGANAMGTSMAPNLTDKQWLIGNGSYSDIANIVRNGVPHPKQFPEPMPAMGGAKLSPNQVCAVAAYVYSLSHK